MFIKSLVPSIGSIIHKYSLSNLFKLSFCSSDNTFILVCFNSFNIILLANLSAIVIGELSSFISTQKSQEYICIISFQLFNAAFLAISNNSLLFISYFNFKIKQSNSISPLVL